MTGSTCEKLHNIDLITIKVDLPDGALGIFNVVRDLS